MSKGKAQHEAFFRWLKDQAAPHGVRIDKLPEHGSQDAGDITITMSDGTKATGELKARERLNVTRALGKHLGKVERADLPYLSHHAPLLWKRLVKGGGARRVPDGVGVVVVLSLEDYLGLLKGES